MLTGKQVSCIILIRVKEKPKNKKRIQNEKNRYKRYCKY